MTRLLLFTNDYPYDRGDAVFVEKEIGFLAERFDSVVVFSATNDRTAPMKRMPDNVRFGGDLRGRAPGDLRRILRPRAVGNVIRALWLEVKAGRVGHLREFVLATVLGLTRAHRPAVRSAAAGDPETVAYGFWGMGGGLVLPWIDGVRRRAVRLHRYDLYEDLSPSGYLPLRPFLFSRVDLILAVSDDGLSFLRRHHARLGTSRKAILSRLGVPGPVELDRPSGGAGYTIVSCSAVRAVKRVDLILSSVQELAGNADGVPVRWVHFGDGPLLGDVERAIEPVPGLTVELRGAVANDRILDFYRSTRVDLFVNASSSEGVPVSMMEAIAHGIPVVATAVGGTPEIVGGRLGTGELVAPNASPKDFAERMRAVLQGGEEYDPRRLWRAEYDATRTGAYAAQQIRSLLDDDVRSVDSASDRRADHER